MTDLNQTSDPRMRIESVAELSDSDLVSLEPSFSDLHEVTGTSDLVELLVERAADADPRDIAERPAAVCDSDASAEPGAEAQATEGTDGGIPISIEELPPSESAEQTRDTHSDPIEPADEPEDDCDQTSRTVEMPRFKSGSSELPLLSRYEDFPADPTVKMLPDFSMADDAPTLRRTQREHAQTETAAALAPLPPPPRLPKVDSVPPPPLSTLLPPPRTPLPPPPSLRPPPSSRNAASLRSPLLPAFPSSMRPKRDSLPPLPTCVIAARPFKPRERDSGRPTPGRSRGEAARTAGARPPLAPIPRELPRLPAVLEWDTLATRAHAEHTEHAEESERTSVIPVSGAVQIERGRARTWSWKSTLPVALGAVLGLVVFLTTLFALQPSRPAAGGASTDALLVTVAGPGGGAVEFPEVFIDGVRRCESSPCLVPGLTEGLHFVTITAPGHVPTSPRVVRLRDREASVLHMQLARPEPGEERAPARVASTPEPLSTPIESLPAAQPLAPLVPPITPPVAPPVAPTPKPVTPITVGSATLDFTSAPSAGVILDGQPLGMSPRLGVRVKPGSHVVVFVHPDKGRILRSVMVEAGARQAVAVRF